MATTLLLLISFFFIVRVQTRWIGPREEWEVPVDLTLDQLYFNIGGLEQVNVTLPGYGNTTIFTKTLKRTKRASKSSASSSSEEEEDEENVKTRKTIHVIWGVMRHEDGTQSYMKEGRRYGEACLLAQDIFAIQESKAPVKEKFQKLTADACRLRDFLECFSEKPDGKAAKEEGGSQDDIVSVSTKGKCGCMRSLGQIGDKRGIFVEDYKKRLTKASKVGRCYIRANGGIESACNHDIWMPYSEVDEGQGKLRRYIGHASEACAPYSDCVRSSKYIGKRCMCRKNSKRIYKKGTCAKGVLTNSPGNAIFLLIVFIPLNLIIKVLI